MAALPSMHPLRLGGASWDGGDVHDPFGRLHILQGTECTDSSLSDVDADVDDSVDDDTAGFNCSKHPSSYPNP